jgi:hypothetical protein
MTLADRRQLAGRAGVVLQWVGLGFSLTSVAIWLLAHALSPTVALGAAVFAVVDLASIRSRSRVVWASALGLKAVMVVAAGTVLVLIQGGSGPGLTQVTLLRPDVAWTVWQASIVPSAVGAILRSLSRGR